MVTDGRQTVAAATAVVVELSQPPFNTAGGIKLVAAFSLGTIKVHYLLPLPAVGPNMLPMEGASHQVCHLVGNGLLNKRLTVLFQQYPVEADYRPAPGWKLNHSRCPAAQVEADLYCGQGAVEMHL